MAKKTLGTYLFHSILPKGVKFDGPITAKELQSKLKGLARDDPKTYARVVTDIKRLGDEVATVEGVSVGLDDIEPHYATRDAIMKPVLEKFKKTEDVAARRKLLAETQDKLKKAVQSHPGSMTVMLISGGRGNPVQYMKSVSSPVAAANAKGDVVPWLITKSYSEGLRPSEAWVAGDEARQSVVEGKIQVTEPGEMGKLMTQTALDQVITSPDCGTTNGILLSTDAGSDLVDRYLARDAAGVKRNTLITSDVLQKLQKVKSVMVRSPITCNHPAGGICAKCYGLDEKGQLHQVGINVGVRSAQSASEPLTQMTLSAKHGTRLAKGQTAELQGLPAVKALLNIPQTFPYAATLAKVSGKVKKIDTAPQGGNYVYVEKEQHYVPPDLSVTVGVGDKLEAGDAISNGVARPDEVVGYKGLGAGRKYLIDKLHSVYKNAGVDLDRRHLEVLVKPHLNYVEIEHDPKEEFLRGDTVSFSEIRDRLGNGAHEVEVGKSEGHVLAEDYLHHTAGTKVTPSVLDELKEHFKHVQVASEKAPQFKFVMHPLLTVPLLRKDWMARLSHRDLKSSLREGAQYNESSHIHGLHPIPGYVLGTEFETGEDGHY